MRSLKLWFLKFYIWLEFIWAEINRNVRSIFAVSLMYLLLWKFDQSLDLLLSNNQYINPFCIILAIPFVFRFYFCFSLSHLEYPRLSCG